MTSEATARKVASAAAKVLKSKTATLAEKAVAASALTQKRIGEKADARISRAAAKILKRKKASKEAKSAAAEALTRRKR